MKKYNLSAYILIVLVISNGYATNNKGSELNIISTVPTARTLSATRQSDIIVNFDKAVDRQTITNLSFWAFGRWSGTATGTFSFSNNDKIVIFSPNKTFSSGENVMVILSHDIKATDGGALRDLGYSWQFWVQSKPSKLIFSQISTMTTNSNNQSSRPYGGIASDLNNDGWLDVTVVNEDTADLRIYMNKADRTGSFKAFKQPTTAVGNRASPSEPSDFNHDGNVDICVVNINDNTISILLGNGDGSFMPAQNVSVGNAPRGIAVLDVDGDGDIDIVNSNYESDNMSVLINNGDGIFSEAQFFDSGEGGEWALAAADMDEDGILDLVVGNQDAQTISVLKNNGKQVFTNIGSQNAQGAVWMLVVGDVNGDGHEDVAAVNSSNNNGAILKGDGTGRLLTATITATDAFPLASDLGDLDGDGDLDWVTSSFSGDWMLFKNNGSGGFDFDQKFDAPIAASCALLFDIDNDLDLDMVLIDEQADVIFIMSNQGASLATFQINSGLNGAWFNTQTPGQGMLIEVLPNNSTMFIAWFTFETEPSDPELMSHVGNVDHRWLTALGPYFDDTANVNISLTTGGLFDNSTPVTNIADGTINIKFSDCTNAMVEYNIPSAGLSGSFSISRIAIDNVSLCHQLNEKLQ
ncbi:MAG: VCBS repeat-containing protein [Alcanivoracaceae bacterium]|nr:VCBS repeat-containing protein [Alcanivoracaceae bacterium]